MMASSIQLFHQALRNNHLFATLRPRCIAALCRSTHFAECRAVVDGRRVLLHTPISSEAMHLAENAFAILRGGRGEAVGSFRILHRELCGHTSIIVEEIADGTTLDCAMLTLDKERLLDGLNDLVYRLQSADVSHNNLRKHNITVDSNSRWHLSRLYYTTQGFGGDSEAIEMLRNEIESIATSNNSLHEPLSTYCSEHIPLCEGLRRITRDGGVGFAYDDGTIAIEPRYGWASDFDEGRAMVMSKDGRMGLIDTKGRELIAPIYEIVEYSASDGNSWVRQNLRWALFDYGGVQVTEWEDRDDVEEAIEL